MQKGSASGAAHGERAPVSWAKITVADFGGTGVSDCAVGNTARDTSGSNPSRSTSRSRVWRGLRRLVKTSTSAGGAGDFALPRSLTASFVMARASLCGASGLRRMATAITGPQPATRPTSPFRECHGAPGLRRSRTDELPPTPRRRRTQEQRASAVVEPRAVGSLCPPTSWSLAMFSIGRSALSDREGAIARQARRSSCMHVLRLGWQGHVGWRTMTAAKGRDMRDARRRENPSFQNTDTPRARPTRPPNGPISKNAPVAPGEACAPIRAACARRGS